MKKQRKSAGKASLDPLVGRAIDRLCKLSSELTRKVYPLSSLPEKRHHWQIAHAISAINLAQCILRDIETPNRGIRLKPEERP
jgi:hypothetical protein